MDLLLVPASCFDLLWWLNVSVDLDHDSHDQVFVPVPVADLLPHRKQHLCWVFGPGQLLLLWLHAGLDVLLAAGLAYQARALQHSHTVLLQGLHAVADITAKVIFTHPVLQAAAATTCYLDDSKEWNCEYNANVLVHKCACMWQWAEVSAVETIVTVWTSSTSETPRKPNRMARVRTS